MKGKTLFLVVGLFIFFLPFAAMAQVVTRSGSIFAKVEDPEGKALPGVNISLESPITISKSATTGLSGSARFASLPPGIYSLLFSLDGFTEVRQEDIRVTVGGQVQLEVTLAASMKEELVVRGESSLVDREKTGTDVVFTRSHLVEIPSARDPWSMMEQTLGVDNDRVNVAGSESGQQSTFFARGDTSEANRFVYDGVNITDPLFSGFSPHFFDFDAFEEIQIMTGGNDPSISTPGVVVNLVTKRPGNQWQANFSTFFVNDDLQGSNTPDDLGDDIRSNLIDRVYDIGFDAGGPVLKDRLFVWGGYRRNQIDLFLRSGLSDKTTLTTYNFKVSFTPTEDHELLFSYSDGDTRKSGRGFNVPIQASETLWEQKNPGTIVDGAWIGQYTWIPNDHTLVSARYGYIGLNFGLIPRGGMDVPIILLSAIPRYESTSFFITPIERPAHDVNVDVNYFLDEWMSGDHEFKFGFEYKTAEVHTFNSVGNGQFIIDYYQTVPGEPLTSGYVQAQHFVDGRLAYDTFDFYCGDTFRKDRVTFNLGFQVYTADGKNLPASVPAVTGFEQFVGPLDFPGSNLSPRFTNFSPRIGGTYDITGNGKTILRGNFARYYQGYDPFDDIYTNPTYTYNGAGFTYTNRNGDRQIQPDELTGGPFYYGGLNGPDFDLAAFESKRLYDDNLTAESVDEFILGLEREVTQDLTFGVSYIYRKYGDLIQSVPFGVTAGDFVFADIFHAETDLGVFAVPYSTLGFVHDGTQVLKNINGYNTSYHGLEITGRKRMSNNFMLNASLMLQNQKAHYKGDEAFFVTTGNGFFGSQTFADPTQVSLVYDDAGYAYPSTSSGKTGIFPQADWTFRASGIYEFPWFTVGGFVRYQQGYPQPLFGLVADANLAGFYGTSRRSILLEPIGDRRYDNIFTLDLSIHKTFYLGNTGRISVFADFFNLTNSNAILQRERRVNTASFNDIQENISPRALRLGIRWAFR